MRAASLRMPKIDFNTVLIAAAVIAGIYIVKKASDVGGAAIDAAAQTYVNLTSGGATEVLGAAILPNGARIPWSQIRLASDATFSYNGVRYRVTARRSDGDYATVRA